MKNTKITLLIILMNISYTYSQCDNLKTLDSLMNLIERTNNDMGTMSIFKEGIEIYSKSIGFSNIELGHENTSNTIFKLPGISVLYTNVLIYKLIEEGRLTLDQKLSDFFPKIKNSENTSIKNLLQHRKTLLNVYNQSQNNDWASKYNSIEDLIELINVRQKKVDQNWYRISFTNALLLSHIIEIVKKKPFFEILDEEIFKPCNCNNSSELQAIKNKDSIAYSYFKHNPWSDKKGNFWTPSYETHYTIIKGSHTICSNAKDVNIFIDCLLNGKLISEKSLEYMKTD